MGFVAAAPPPDTASHMRRAERGDTRNYDKQMKQMHFHKIAILYQLAKCTQLNSFVRSLTWRMSGFGSAAVGTLLLSPQCRVELGGGE